MSGTSAKMFVLVGERFACIKIVGRANFTSSIDFKTLVADLRDKGYDYFVLELSECSLMDSTFLGVLAGFGMKLNSRSGIGGCRPGMVLLNPNARITELLESLGVLHLFQTSHGTLEPPPGAQATEREVSAHSQEEVTRACLEAHQFLSSLSPENAARFKDVTQYLADDLKKLKKNQQG